MSLPPWLDAAWRNLSARLADASLAHALLVCGPAGLGKRALVEALVRAALCDQRRNDGHACGQCRSCALLAAGSHPDRIGVGLETRDDGKLRSDIVIEQIRTLSQRLALASQFGGLQVAVIDPADRLNASAANGLLKTLEEPTAQTVIVLVSDQPARLPATIRSRCQRIDARTPTAAQGKAWLVGQGVPEAAAMQALQVAAGNPGLALELHQQDGVGLRKACRDDLCALLSGRRRALEAAEAWAADRPEQRLWHTAVLAGAEAECLAKGERGPLGLTASTEIPKLAAWFANVNRVRGLLATQLRVDLLILELLHGWQATWRR